MWQSNQSAQELADERARMRTEILETNPNIDDPSLTVTVVIEGGTMEYILQIILKHNRDILI